MKMKQRFCTKTFYTQIIQCSSYLYSLRRTIAHCFDQQEIYSSAIEYFEQSLRIQEDEDNHDTNKKSEIIHLNNQLEFCHFMSNQCDMAYYYCLNKSLKLLKYTDLE
jgi:hypothetical protein